MTMNIYEIRRANLVTVLAKRKEKGKTQADLADSLDSTTSYISQLKGEKKKVNMGNVIARKIELIDELPYGWMDTEHPDVNETSINLNQSPNFSTASIRPVPLISWVQAGNWTNSEPDLSHSEMYQCPVETGRNGYALRVEGESMSPRYLNGDIIFVDPDKTPDIGKRVIAICGSGATFKELVSDNGQLYLKALNEDWKPKYMPVEPDCSIIGVVVGSYRPE